MNWFPWFSPAPSREPYKPPVVEWVVKYAPDVSEKTPYYLDLEFDGRSGPGGPIAFFATEAEAVAELNARVEGAKRRERLKLEAREVMRVRAP